MDKNQGNNESYGQAQLLLAEKRTSLAVLRTGIMIFALPMTILTALIALSDSYDVRATLWLWLPIVIVSSAMFVLAFYLIIRAVMNISRVDSIIKKLCVSVPEIDKLMPK
ncbi:MAG: hypothetical protein GY863_04715 [bacterium]|nr:hypothetical protein [bacterium]